MILPGKIIPARRSGKAAFVNNWVSGAGDSRSLRRRLMAALRLSSSVLGISRKRMGPGMLGIAGPAIAVSLSFAMPAAAFEQGPGSVASGTDAAALGIDNEASGDRSTAVGVNNRALGLESTALGTDNTAFLHGTAVGYNNMATGFESTALGLGNTASVDQSTAVGIRNTASGWASTALGSGNTASGPYSTAVGYNNVATDQDNTAVGMDNIVTGWIGVGLGNRNKALADWSTAVGSSNTASGDLSTAVGYQNEATAYMATAMGFNNLAYGEGGTAVGFYNKASGESSTSLGYDNTASGDHSTAVGTRNTASGWASTAVGYNNVAIDQDSAAMGTGNIVTGWIGVGLGIQNKASADWSVAIGTQNIASGPQATALGFQNEATHYIATAMGIANHANGERSTAVGTQNTASGDSSTATGYSNIANNQGSSAFGLFNIASGQFSTALGSFNNASGDSSVAIGDHAATALGADNAIAVGTYATASNANDVALGSSSVTAAVVNTQNVTINDVTYDFAGTNATSTVSIGDAGAERTLTNLAAGRIGADSTDGVNGSQLHATNLAITTLAETPLTFAGNSGTVARKLGETVNILGGGTTTGAYDGANLRTEVDAAGNMRLLMAEAPRFGDVVINADGSGRITGVTAGVADTDAVNVGQLAAVQEAANAGWNLSAQGANETNVGPDDTVDLGNTDGNIVVAKADDSNDVTFDLADDLIIGNSITVGDAYIDGTGLTIDGGPSVTTTGIDAGDMRITNVAPGAIGSASMDAINGSQLWGMGDSIAMHLGGSAYGVQMQPDGTLSAPSYQIAAIDPNGNVTTATHDNVGDALGEVSTSLTNVNTQVQNLGDQINEMDALSWDENAGAYNATRDGSPSRITGVAPGTVSETSTDAVNGSQLHATNERIDVLDEKVTGIDNRVTTIEGDIIDIRGDITNIEAGVAEMTDRGVKYDGGVGGSKDTITLEGDQGTLITNLKDGEISETSTDAVNGSQLHATNQAVAELDDSALKYDRDADGNKTNTVTLLGGDLNAPVLISNVAAGVADTDAVNVGQLNEGMQTTLSESKSYTDNRVAWGIEQSNHYTDQVAVTTLNEANSYTDYKFGQLNKEIGDVRGEARQAAAIGLAAASLRYDDRPGKASVAAGGGFWRGEGALAFGAGYTSEDGRLRSNLSATTSGGHWGLGAGVSFTLN